MAANTCDTGRKNACGGPMFHLKRIGPAATKPGVASIMDFQRVTYMIGRNAAKVDFLLDSSNYMQGASLSRCHARVVRQTGNQHKLYDDSLNGVFVNNIKIAGSCILREGDRVTFGHPAGVKYPPGSRVRQPDSEHQFMFERCTCPVVSYSSSRASPSESASQNGDSFKVPQISPTEKPRTKRHTRNVTQSFTVDEIRNLKKEFHEMQAAKSNEIDGGEQAGASSDVSQVKRADDTARETPDTIMAGAGDNAREQGLASEQESLENHVAVKDSSSVSKPDDSGDNLTDQANEPASAVAGGKDEVSAKSSDMCDEDSSDRNLKDAVVVQNQEMETEEKELAENDVTISHESLIESEVSHQNQDKNKMSDTSSQSKERETDSNSFNTQLEGTMKSIMDVLNELKDDESNHTDTSGTAAHLPNCSATSADLISNDMECNTMLKKSPSKDASIQTSQSDAPMKGDQRSPTKDACIQTSQVINQGGDKPVEEHSGLNTELLFKNDNSENASNSEGTAENLQEMNDGPEACLSSIESDGQSGTSLLNGETTADMENTDNVLANCAESTETSLGSKCEAEKMNLHQTPENKDAQAEGNGELDQMDIDETDSKIPEAEDNHLEHNETEQAVVMHEESGSNSTSNSEVSGSMCGSDEKKHEVLVSETGKDNSDQIASNTCDSKPSDGKEICSTDTTENEQTVVEMESITSISGGEEQSPDAESSKVIENNSIEAFEVEKGEAAKISTRLCADESAGLHAGENTPEVRCSPVEKDNGNQSIRREADLKSSSENHPVEFIEAELTSASPKISVGAHGDGEKVDDNDKESDTTENEIIHVSIGKEAENEKDLHSDLETTGIDNDQAAPECSSVKDHDEVKDKDGENSDDFECVVISKQHTDTSENVSNESLQNKEHITEANDKQDVVLSDSMEYDFPEVGSENGGLVLSDSIEYEYDAESDGEFHLEEESDSEELQNEECKDVNADKCSDILNEEGENDQPLSDVICPSKSLENEDVSDGFNEVKKRSDIEEANDNRVDFTESDITTDANNKEEVHSEHLNSEEETQRYSETECDGVPNDETVETDSKPENDAVSDFNEKTSECVVGDLAPEESGIDHEDVSVPPNSSKDNNESVGQTEVRNKDEEDAQSSLAAKGLCADIGNTGMEMSGNRKRKISEDTEVQDENVGKRHCNDDGNKSKSIKKKLASLFGAKRSDSSDDKSEISKVESMKQAVKSFFKSGTKKSYNIENESCIDLQEKEGKYKSLALESPEIILNPMKSDEKSTEMKDNTERVENNDVETVIDEIESKVEDSENKILANDCQLSIEKKQQSISDIPENVGSHVESAPVVENHCIDETKNTDNMEIVHEEKTLQSTSDSPEQDLTEGDDSVADVTQDADKMQPLGSDRDGEVSKCKSNDGNDVEDIDEISDSKKEAGDYGSSDDLIDKSVSDTDDDIGSDDEILERKLLEMPVTPEKSSDNSEAQMSPMIGNISKTGNVVSRLQSPIIAKQGTQRIVSSEAKIDEISCEFSDEEDNFISPEIDFSHFDDDDDDETDEIDEEMESDIERVEEDESPDLDFSHFDDDTDEMGEEIESDIERVEEDESVGDEDELDDEYTDGAENGKEIDNDIQTFHCDEANDVPIEIPDDSYEENEIPLHFSEELDVEDGSVADEAMEESWAIKTENESLESKEDRLATKPAVKRKCSFEDASTPKRKSPDNMDTPEKDTNSRSMLDHFKTPTSVLKLRESSNNSCMESPCDISSTQLMNCSQTPELDGLSDSQFSRVSEQFERKMNDPAKPSTSRNKAKDLIAKLRARREIKKEAVVPSCSPSSSQGSDREATARGTEARPEQTAALMRLEEVDKHVNRCRSVINVMKTSFDKHIALRDNPRVQAWRQDLSEVEKRLTFPKTIIAVVGDTGAGKSSLMNAILDHRSILPTSGMRACTAVVVEVVQNTQSSTAFEADIEFLQRKEWFDELHILLKDLTGLDGTVKNRPPDPTSDAYVSFCKIKAVYGKIDSFQVLSRYSTVTHWLGKVKVLRATDPESFRRQVEKYIETQDPGAGGQYWPIVKHVRLRLPNCDVCSSGAALVDLPGVRDSNAARDKIAREYLKNCTAVWVVSSIHRAIDDKTAKDLLGENFRRQLLMDGQYGSIAFICTKTDILMPSEIIRPLKLEDETKEHEDRILEMEQQKTGLDLDIAAHTKEIRGLTRNIETLQEEAQELRDNLTEISALLAEPGDRDSQQTEEHEALKEYEEELRDKEEQITEKEKRIDALLTYKQEAGQQMLELEKKLTVHRKAIAAICAKARNEYSKSQIKRDFKAGLREMKRRAGMLGNDGDEEEEEDDDYDDDDNDEDIGSTADNLHVFCCSSTEYQKMKNLLTDDGPPQVFSSVADTQIPGLRNYVHEMTSVRRLQAVERMIRGLGRYVFDLQSYTADGEYVTKGARSNAKSTIDGQLHRFDVMVAPVLQELTNDIDSVFDGSIRSKMQEGSANATYEATSTCAKWGAPFIRDKTKDKREGGLHFMTYKATVRRQGVYTSPTFGPVNFNEDLSEPMYRSMTIVWDKAFSGMLWKVLDKVKSQILEKLRAFTTDLVTQLHKLGVPKDRSSRVSAQLHGSASNKLSEMVNQLKEIITNKQRDISRLVTPHIQNVLAPTYDVSATEAGTGMFNRIKGHMSTGIEGKRVTMFDEATEELMQSLMELQREVIHFVQTVCKTLMQDLRAAFEPLWEAPSNYKVLRAAFLKPITEACSEVRQVYSDAGLRNTEEEAVMPVTTDTAGPSTSAATATGSSFGNGGKIIYNRQTTQGAGVRVKIEPTAGPSGVARHVTIKQEPSVSTTGLDTSLTTFGDQTLDDLVNGRLEISPVEVTVATEKRPQSGVTILQTGPPGQVGSVSGISSVNQSAIATQTGSTSVQGLQTSLVTRMTYRPVIPVSAAAQASPAPNYGILKTLPGGMKMIEPCQMKILSSGQRILHPVSTVTSDTSSKTVPTLIVKKEKSGKIDSFFTSPKSTNLPNAGKENSSVRVVAGSSAVRTGCSSAVQGKVTSDSRKKKGKGKVSLSRSNKGSISQSAGVTIKQEPVDSGYGKRVRPKYLGHIDLTELDSD